jgi:hypothetical protein
LERFRGVNPEWLLFGRGEMYKSTDTKVSSPVAEPSLFDNQPSVSANYPTIENKAENSPSIDHNEDIFDSKPNTFWCTSSEDIPLKDGKNE